MRFGRSNGLLRRVLIASSLPALLAASYFYYPHAFDGPAICYIKLSFGFPCMGCGMTRSFCSLAHLEFAQALHYHLLGPPLFFYLAGMWGFAVARMIRPVEPPAWWHAAGRGILLLMMILYCGRMVPFFSTPEGWASPVTKNMIVRIVRWDWSNTYEPP